MATYYIDYNAANDSGNGLTKGACWKRHPYMKGFGGSYSHAAGDVFVFKGGVTWPAVCFRMAIAAGGTAGNIDTYTVDATWYTGGAWSRPIFDGEHATLTTSQDIVQFVSKSYITFNQLEVKGHKALVGNQGASFNLYDANHVHWTGCYVHDWSLAAGVTTDNAHGGIINTSGEASMTDVVIDSCEISNAEWTGIRQTGLAVRQVTAIHDSVIHDVSSAVLFCCDFYNNTVYNMAYPAGNVDFDPSYHANLLYLDAWNASGSIVGIPSHVYNNRIYDINSPTACFYPATGQDATFYIYNNVCYGYQGQSMAIMTDPYGGSGNIITLHVLNNTFVLGGSNRMVVYCEDRGGNPKIKSVVVRNNHVIGANATMVAGVYAAKTESNNLNQTPAEATAEGYDALSEYAVVAGGSTIDAGYDTSATVTEDIDGVSRPQDGVVDIGAYEYTAGVDPPGFRVYYAANGATSGTVPTDETEHPEDDPVTVLGNTGSLAQESYRAFVKWNTAANGSGTDYYAGATMTMPGADVTLYAQWQLKSLLVRT